MRRYCLQKLQVKTGLEFGTSTCKNYCVDRRDFEGTLGDHCARLELTNMPAHRTDNRTPPAVSSNGSPQDNSPVSSLRLKRRAILGSAGSSIRSYSPSLAGYSYRSSSTLSSLMFPHRSSPDVDIILAGPLDKAFECPVCCQLLRYPVQFEECGHRCCSACLPELMRVAPRCPVDHYPVDRDRVSVDKSFQKEVEEIQVKCSHHEKGCSWISSYKDLLPHLEECGFVPVSCPKQCDAEFERRFLEKHMRDDCPRRDLTCKFCHVTVTRENEDDHLQTCDQFPVPCPNGCKKKDIPRVNLEKHMDSECTKQTVPCPFQDSGCKHRCERKEVAKHIREQPELHLEMAGRTMHALKQTLDLQTRMAEKHAMRLKSMESKVDGLEKLYGSQLVWKIDNYEEKYEDAKSGRKTTIYSPPFLTSRHGYKMALSACLYGDGKAKGEYMSIFVCICRGDYDALLVWPFGHRITFTLIDQCQDPEARRNVTYTIRPNTCQENRPFLGRPSAERNASFGAQRFVELETVKTLDFVRDDCMFIKVTIDSDKMIML